MTRRPLDQPTVAMVCNTYNSRGGVMSNVTLYHWEPNANSCKPMLALME